MSATNVVVTVYGTNGQEATYETPALQAASIIKAKTSGFAHTIIDGGEGDCLDIPLIDVSRITISFP